MEAIGIIFFACLAFAIAILILITCCFFKVNGGKDTRDLEMFRPDTSNRFHQMGYNKTGNENQLSNHSHNVILFLNKKDKYSSESKQNLTGNNRKRSNDDGDDIEIDNGNQNDGGQQNDIGYNTNDTCNKNSNHVQLPESTNYHPTHEVSAQSQEAHNKNVVSSNHIQFESTSTHSSHGMSGHNNAGFHNDTSHSSHGFGHSSDGFSSHFSGSQHGGWGDHSGGSSHFGHHDDGNGDY